MKKGVVLLISAIAFGGFISGGLTSCSSTSQKSSIQDATIKLLPHGDFVKATIANQKESYKEGDTISLELTFTEGYGLHEILLNGVTQESKDNIKLEAGENVIEIFVKNLVFAEGTTNLRDFEFESINNGQAYAITSYVPTGTFPEIANFPSSYLGKPVTEIKYVTKDVITDGQVTDTIVVSRYSYGGLKGVNIPASITKIDTRAFRANGSLTKITVDEGNTVYASDGEVLLNKAKTELLVFPQGISGKYKVPDSVTKIGENAFFGCQTITEIDLNKVVEIGANAFNSSKRIKEIVIPNTVTTLGEGCFSTSVELEKVTLSNKLTNIPKNCFYKNSSLKEVEIPASVKTISDLAFFECGSLETFTMHEGLESIGTNGVAYTSVSSLDFPSTLKTLGSSAFSGSQLLKSVSLKEGITTIGSNCFRSSLLLEKVNIPASVTKIEDEAFFANLSLKEFDVAEGNTIYKDIDGVLFSKDGTELVAYPSSKGVEDRGYIPEDKKTYEIPEGTTKLGFECFSGVSNSPEGESTKPYSITKVIIPKSVTSMNQSFNLALLEVVEYKGTSEEFKKIATNGYIWNYGASEKMQLVCSGDK